MALKPINLDYFYKGGTNVHEAIVVASRRARQVNEEVKIEFNQRIETLVPKSDVETEGEIDVNPDQLRISIEFEKRPKPTDVALHELIAGEHRVAVQGSPAPARRPRKRRRARRGIGAGSHGWGASYHRRA